MDYFCAKLTKRINMAQENHLFYQKSYVNDNDIFGGIYFFYYLCMTLYKNNVR